MRLHIHTKRHFNGALQEVWDLVTDMERFPSFFGGFGPIPAVTQVEVLYDTPKKGEKRKVHSADGGIITEEIVDFSPPKEHRYRLIGGFAPPFSWMVFDAEGVWRLSEGDDGTWVVWDYSFGIRSWLLIWLTAPLVWIFFRGAMKKCLDKMAHTYQ